MCTMRSILLVLALSVATHGFVRNLNVSPRTRPARREMLTMASSKFIALKNLAFRTRANNIKFVTATHFVYSPHQLLQLAEAG